jgi:hypothetical protein
MSNKFYKNIGKNFSIIVAYLFIFLFFYLILVNFETEIKSKLYELKMLPIRERFTELYFNDPILPHSIINKENIQFSFTIHNLEGKDMKYDYSVYYKSESGRILNIASGRKALKDGDNVSLAVNFSGTMEGMSDDNGAIFVELPQYDQSIHFILLNK